MATRFIETIKDEIYYIDIIPGQLILCTDTNESYFDTDEEARILLEDIIYLNKENEKEKVISPLLNRVYVVKETGTIYRYEGTWFRIEDSRTLICTVFKNDEYIPTTLMKNGTSIAPRTLASVVYNDAGIAVGTEIEEANKLTLCKTKYVYVEATQNGQKVFRIPYPISDYDFRKNFMTVIINNVVYDESRFTIRDDNYFVLNDTEVGLDSGQLVLFVFYYNVYIDINDGVLLTTKNLRDRCVTEPKLDNDAVSTRTIIPKNVTNQKLADGCVDARVLGSKVINSTHLDLSNLQINSSNVTDSADKRFVTDTLINKWNATSTEVTNSPKIHVSATEPTQNVKNTDIWVDITNFIFKVRVSGTWKAMGAVYN